MQSWPESRRKVMAMTENLVHYSTEGPVARLTLDSPHNRNALSSMLVAQLRDGLRRAADDAAVRAIVLGHTGGTFCAGADLSEATGGDPIKLRKVGIQDDLLVPQQMDDTLRGYVQQNAIMEGRSATPTGRLSLKFEIPADGQRIDFLRVGGNPELTLDVRSSDSVTKVTGVIWLILCGIAIMMLAIVLIYFFPGIVLWLPSLM